MDLQFTPQEEAFRAEVQAFLKDKLPKNIANKVKAGQRLSKEDQAQWHAILNERGWYANHWPQEHGGPGWGAVEKFIFDTECALAGGPRIVPFGVNMLGPVLIKYGSEAQKKYWLPRILNGDDWWCQGYSEPGSGSDLASLKTRAERTENGYIVNGQKTWTTLGQYADWMFCLARTNPEAKAQRGISMLLIDMRQPGVTVRPIRTLDGGADVNEVWLDNVHVPFENLVGEENEGWTYAKYLLGHERTGIAGLGHCHRELAILKDVAARTLMDGEPAIRNPRLRAKIARIEVDIRALEMLLLRVAANSDQGPGPQASILKIRGSEIQQDLARLQMEVMGVDGWPYDPAWMRSDAEFTGPGPDFAAAGPAGYFDMRKTTIYGGTTEVQKGIISKMIIGV